MNKWRRKNRMKKKSVLTILAKESGMKTEDYIYYRMAKNLLNVEKQKNESK